jgi:hypothetical protein
MLGPSVHLEQFAWDRSALAVLDQFRSPLASPALIYTLRLPLAGCYAQLGGSIERSILGRSSLGDN